MWYKSDSECRREGERAFERNKYSSGRNPYEEHFASYDDSRHHRSWDEGFDYAKRRDEERREEEKAREYAEQREKQNKQQEEKYRDRKEYERQQEELGGESVEEE